MVIAFVAIPPLTTEHALGRAMRKGPVGTFGASLGRRAALFIVPAALVSGLHPTQAPTLLFDTVPQLFH